MISDKNTAVSRIVELADQCVKCGLCVPYCPTYQVQQEENESPRGRIALAHALVRDELSLTSPAIVHLEHCLSCMSCERVCPSEVKYGQLIEETRAFLQSSNIVLQRGNWIRKLVSYPRLLKALVRLARTVHFNRWKQNQWIASLLQQFGLLELSRELPTLPVVKRLPVRSSFRDSSRGRVGLFLGCIASVFDQDTHEAAIQLLTALGYEVIIPPKQGCCGALDKHAGDRESAMHLAIRTRAAFQDYKVDTVLISASGCFSTVRDSIFAGTSIRATEIHHFLATDPEWNHLRFRPLPQKMALHTPCTQANIAKADKEIFKLLSFIPELSIIPLPIEPRCCGAAGDYFLRYPEISGKLREEKLNQTKMLKPDYLITSNIGCRIYLNNGLQQRKEEIPVMHPLELLCKQLVN